MKRLPQRSAAHRGFTLIEVMITVAIVAILASVAYPSYRDYVIRGRLTDASNGLTALRADMERHFQDNRSYATVGAFTSPCTVARQAGDFDLDCIAGQPTATTFTLQAVGRAGTSVNGFALHVNEAGVQTTEAIGSVTGWSAVPANCWVMRRGQAC